MKPVPFFTDDITVTVHSSTVPEFVGKTMTLRDFNLKTKNMPGGLYEMENGDLLYRNIKGDWIEGKETA